MKEIQIIIEIFTLLVGLYLAFFKSYFQEKGKNLATKEDIGEITETVENIKNQLSFSTQSKLNLKTEERNSIVNCFEKYSYWQNTIVEIYTGNINEQSKTKLSDYENKMDDAYFQFQLSCARMNLFINNIDITKTLNDLKLKTMELQHITENHIDTAKGWVSKWEKVVSYAGLIDKGEEKIELLKERSELSKKFNADKLVKYKEVIDISGDFQIHVYQHIQALTKLEN